MITWQGQEAQHEEGGGTRGTFKELPRAKRVKKIVPRLVCSSPRHLGREGEE
jgi:hypothetical protein